MVALMGRTDSTNRMHDVQLVACDGLAPARELLVRLARYTPQSLCGRDTTWARARGSGGWLTKARRMTCSWDCDVESQANAE
jgi:hypothetical protein